jgi:hypothetical protein
LDFPADKIETGKMLVLPSKQVNAPPTLKVAVRPIFLESSMAKRWRTWVLCLIAIPLIVWWLERSLVTYGVGGTDLEIRFLVTDAANGGPIKGAKIAVHSDGGFYNESEEKEFELVTGKDGIASRICHDNVCDSTQSWLGFTNPFSVSPPYWSFSVSAPEFEPSMVVNLAEFIYANPQLLEQTGARQTRLVVPVSIKKTAG